MFVGVKRILFGLLIAPIALAQAPAPAPAPAPVQLTLNNGRTVEVTAVPFDLTGTATPGSEVVVSIEGLPDMKTTTDATGHWTIANITVPLKTGTYNIAVRTGSETVNQLLRIQLLSPTNLQRQSFLEQEQPVYPSVVTQLAGPDTWQEMTDRWRIAPPPYELDEKPRARALGKSGATLDPYNQNMLKGDLPLPGTQDKFIVFTGVWDTLAESRTVPTPSGFSGNKPGNYPFFGKSNQNVFNQNLILSFEFFQGNTAFRPPTQRARITVIGNLNYVQLGEVGLVKPDVRRGTSRTDGDVAVQEAFYERKLADVSVNYDFISLRVGSQPFNSDFRGFIFSDTNLGARLFGTLHSNRMEYNVAFFDRLEKDTNSGLNTFEMRDQKVGVANIYMQDFLTHGYTQQFSVHYVKDDPTFHYDENGVLVRPAPVGVFTPHEIKATYLGEAGLGKWGRFNIDQAIYYVFGTDSLNPIAGPDPRLSGKGNKVDIGAGFAAVELTYDHDWWRPRLGFLYSSGDSNPRDRNARGFDSIFDNTFFAGGGFSFFNRLGIRLPPTGVSLVERGSLIPALRSSKDEGQPNYVNPGLQLATLGVDVDFTPRVKGIFTANYIRLDKPEPIETILFQDGIHKDLGIDISAGARWRPFLNQNFVVVGGVAGFKPGQGWKDIYEKDDPLYQFFMNLILTF